MVEREASGCKVIYHQGVVDQPCSRSVGKLESVSMFPGLPANAPCYVYTGNKISHNILEFMQKILFLMRNELEHLSRLNCILQLSHH